VLSRWGNLIRSSLIGVFTGILPAAGGSISNILAYDQAKKASKTPELFGTGTPEGIVAPESANNATAGGALITMMALGIPGDIVTAIMLGALLIHNVIPSPTFITEAPTLAYGIFMAFFLANFIMVALQAFCLRAFVLVTRLRMYVLAGVILAYCGIGIFALNNIVFDMWTLFIFGIVGLIMKTMGFPLAPMILGVVLGHIAELNLNRALSTSDDLLLFLTRPWSLFFLILGAFSIFFPHYQKQRGRERWTLAYPGIMAICLAVPLFLMDGAIRPALAGIIILFGGWLLWKHARNGWALDEAASASPTLREG
jgi:putative tricarboxylic transport membrane protein